MLKMLAKIVAWFLGGVLGLGLIAYAVLFIANLNDRAPAAEIAALKSLQEPASHVVSSDNSYLYMLGFSGPPDVDPMILGLERYEWMEEARPEFRTEDDPLILACDDEPVIADLLAQLLGTVYARVQTATSEAELLQRIQDETPSVVLTDPLDGSSCEILRVLRAQPAMRGVPIVYTSALIGAEEEAMEAGADVCMPKPFDIHRVLKVVASLLASILAELGEISGRVFTESLLDDVFSQFCVGK